MTTPTQNQPKGKAADCPNCGSIKSLARHNAQWACHKCGFTKITESDLRQIRAEFARMGGKAKARAMSKQDRREAALKMVRAKAEKRLKRISQAEQKQ